METWSRAKQILVNMENGMVDCLLFATSAGLHHFARYDREYRMSREAEMNEQDDILIDAIPQTWVTCDLLAHKLQRKA